MKKEEKEPIVQAEFEKLAKISHERISRLRKIISGALTDNVRPNSGYTSTEIVIALLSEAYSIESAMINVDLEVAARNIIESQNKESNGQGDA